jgi:hypothetical protein
MAKFESIAYIKNKKDAKTYAKKFKKAKKESGNKHFSYRVVKISNGYRVDEKV